MLSFNEKLVLLLVFTSAAMVSCQVPGFGGCPDFDSQPDFDMNRYLGTWYEAEHYVNIFEIGTRCVKTNYTKAVDGRFLVSNEIMNRFTGVKRVLDGEIRLIVKGAESKMNVKYSTLPVPYTTEQMILETDYDSFAVVWSCSSLGVANTQNAWILTREKLAPGTVMQKAYGVLDKYKLSKTFFVKTDQNSCAIAEAAPNETSENNTWRRRRSLGA
ncbi:Lipocalin family conserved site,Lipocalin/cytosolic fatty-acid binding [Cinara cedri]|uniref:Lipocalin family conserved site,Lipocalin/cytosolic fatty-acid binding n=1 Tax=Cinara cedri TaxID=506608 RepID=A0A5E4MXD4_9HEMI|nr:Lipocalin family conserved site,Lipocalin/cytosolic fatty-acid binding [Cinara cedri]